MTTTESATEPYIVEPSFGRGYQVADTTDGERVARVSQFMPGPLVSVTGSQINPPTLARAIAAAMVMVADDIDKADGRESRNERARAHARRP